MFSKKVRVEYVGVFKAVLQLRQTAKFGHVTNSDTVAITWLLKCFA